MSEQALETITAFVPVSDRIATAGQPSAEQFAAVKRAGYDVVVNLLPEANTPPDERATVESEGMTYVHIPVVWTEPTPGDVQRFFDTMQANGDKRVFVHCAKNMRVSAFVYLYRVAKQGIAPGEAVGAMHQIWTPNPTWQALIEQTLQENGVAADKPQIHTNA